MKIEWTKAAIGIALAMPIALAGCTTGDDTSDDSGDPSTTTDLGNPTNDNDPSGDSDDDFGFGSFDDDGSFNDNMIDSDLDNLENGDTTGLSLQLVDGSGDPVTMATDVFFSSDCASSGLADISPAVVTNSTGRIETEYRALGCTGSDTITARTSVNGRQLEARTTLETDNTTLGALSFSEASEPLIGIQGTGILPPQSRVSFLVTDRDGNPVPNQQVEFALDTTVGGLSLNPEAAQTNQDGIAATSVTSGTQATTVQVRAESTGPNGNEVSARSRTLAVTTGIADNDSFSVSVETPNIEGYDFGGNGTSIVVRAADRFNNPVPDGTTVTFTTEGGAVPGSCQTDGGMCSVEFIAQDPRPANGRATVRVTAIGEETFVDSNPSNGRYDEGERFTDLPEAYRDDNENRVRDSNEPYLDFNDDSSYNLGSNSFTGLLCDQRANCDPNQDALNVRRNVVVVMSGSQFFIDGLPGEIDLSNGAVTVRPSIEDRRDQVPPADSTITAEVTQGQIEGPSSFTVRKTSERGPYTEADFRIEPAEEAGNGILRITVTTPEGVISRRTVPIRQAGADSDT